MEAWTELWQRIEKYNDPEAMIIMGEFYIEGENGLPKKLSSFLLQWLSK